MDHYNLLNSVVKRCKKKRLIIGKWHRAKYERFVKYKNPIPLRALVLKLYCIMMVTLCSGLQLLDNQYIYIYFYTHVIDTFCNSSNIFKSFNENMNILSTYVCMIWYLLYNFVRCNDVKCLLFHFYSTLIALKVVLYYVIK